MPSRHLTCFEETGAERCFQLRNTRCRSIRLVRPVSKIKVVVVPLIGCRVDKAVMVAVGISTPYVVVTSVVRPHLDLVSLGYIDRKPVLLKIDPVFPVFDLQFPPDGGNHDGRFRCCIRFRECEGQFFIVVIGNVKALEAFFSGQCVGNGDDARRQAKQRENRSERLSHRCRPPGRDCNKQPICRLRYSKKAGAWPAFRKRTWWAVQGSNLRPLPCEGNALPLS